MRPEWQAHIDELLQEYRSKRAQFKELQEQMAEMEATVTTEDEMVTVTVGPQGQLRRLELNPRVYRRLSPTELADAVLATTQEAARQVAEQMQAALRPLAPGGDQGLDLNKILGSPPKNFDEVRERYGFRDL